MVRTSCKEPGSPSKDPRTILLTRAPTDPCTFRHEELIPVDELLPALGLPGGHPRRPPVRESNLPFLDCPLFLRLLTWDPVGNARVGSFGVWAHDFGLLGSPGKGVHTLKSDPNWSPSLVHISKVYMGLL